MTERLSERDLADMQAWSEGVLDAFGVCTTCGAEHEPPRGPDCLFCIADTQPAPPLAAE